MNKKQKTKNNKRIGITLGALMFFVSMFIVGNVQAQTNVTLFSVSPSSAKVGDAVVISGSNLLQCAPVDGTTRCNVQFHDINLRRSTVSGTKSSTNIQAVVAAGLCPGTTTIKVGELNNFSNAIPFSILDEPGTALYAGCRVITSISPTSGTFGTTITINGRNLHGNVQLYNSAFAKTDVTGTMNASATQVTFTMPNSLTPGTYSVRVGPSVSDVSNGIPFALAGDTSAPFISNIRINNITTSGATVLWDTSEPADGQVEICPSQTRCSTNSPLISALTMSHVVNLSSLNPNTRYYLWIKSKDGAGNLATAGPMTFRTLSTVTPTPTPKPVVGMVTISNIQISNITRTSAMVTWNTDKPSDSRVVVCTYICYQTLAYSPDLTISHTLDVSDLKSDRGYSIKVQSVASNGEKGSSEKVYFKTLPSITISNLKAINITSSGATITWDTNYPADGGVIICTYFLFCSFSSTLVAYDSNMTSSHALSISGLLPNRLYYYKVKSADLESFIYSTRQNFSTSN